MKTQTSVLELFVFFFFNRILTLLEYSRLGIDSISIFKTISFAPVLFRNRTICKFNVNSMNSIRINNGDYTFTPRLIELTFDKAY